MRILIFFLLLATSKYVYSQVSNDLLTSILNGQEIDATEIQKTLEEDLHKHTPSSNKKEKDMEIRSNVTFVGSEWSTTTTTTTILKKKRGKKSIEIKKNGKSVRKFSDAKDFTAEERERYPVAYKILSNDNRISKELDSALEKLKKYDRNGLEIYQLSEDRDVFELFLGEEGGISTAVHEALHNLDFSQSTKKHHAFKPIGKEFIYMPRRKTVSINNIRKHMLPKREKEGFYVKSYLTGKLGKQGLDILLEELNAHAHTNNTIIRLADGEQDDKGLDPGMLEMLYYTALYVKYNKEKNNSTWKLMKEDPQVNKVLYTLWRQAEEVISQACQSEHIIMYPLRLPQIYSKENIEALSEVFNHKRSFYPPEGCNIGRSQLGQIDYNHDDSVYDTTDRNLPKHINDRDLKTISDERGSTGGRGL